MDSKSLIIWLNTIIALVFLMIVIGGITRLTHSGLSIVDWKPIMGTLPPLSESSWQKVFEQYQQFPEYKLINNQMTLSEFKWIYFWEYIHRLLGRLIGLAVFLPYLFFLVMGTFKNQGALSAKMIGIFFLGGLQGLMGWYMVKSGLVHNPYVSHYRLAAHFMLALLIFAALLWVRWELKIGFGYSENKKAGQIGDTIPNWFGHLSWIILGLIAFQLFYGALVAGLKAGLVYNTFPLMGNNILPYNPFALSPAWTNIFSNPGLVQFIHRFNAWVLIIFMGIIFWKSKTIFLGATLKNNLVFLSLSLLLQFILGVATLLFHVPVSLGSLHQALALIVFALALKNIAILKFDSVSPA